MTAALAPELDGFRTSYAAFRVEGALLSRDLIERIASGDRNLPGGRPEDYHLAAAERLGEAASRSWQYLRGAYRAFRDRLDALPASDPGTSLTRERWLLVLLNELGFGRIPFIRGGRTSHQWEHIPVHLLGWNDKLDRPNTAKGRAPQSMLQEFLNAGEDHLWAILSNGRLLRILRDATSLIGGAYLEFDLEAIFDGNSYSDFALLYALCHESRLELLPREDGVEPTPADCWLERWRTLGIETGERAKEQLRLGVKEAIGLLGTGFLEANPDLRSRLSSGKLSKTDFHHELLRLAYQLVVWFAIEDRRVLLLPDAPSWAEDRYDKYFSASRLRRIARRRLGDQYGDLWRTVVTVFNALGADQGLSELGLPALGGLYFRAGKSDTGNGRPMPDMFRDRILRNHRLLAAIAHLDTVRNRRGRKQRVDYAHLGADEIGSVYESLLEEIPQCEPAAARFWLESKPGNERKTTGSYYTSPPLVEELLNTTLQALIDEVAKSCVPDDLLGITVCDPACGSGYFLVAAAWRIARKYAAVVCSDDEPPPEIIRSAMWQVVARCIYGIDINPLAVELAQVSLWLESTHPGLPFAFLDSHIKVGNALLGATPALLARGLPDAAFKALDDDDKRIVAQVRRRNATERAGTGYGGQIALLEGEILDVSNRILSAAAEEIRKLRVRSVADTREQARRFRELASCPEMLRKKRVADAWCAAFAWPHVSGGPDPITTSTLRLLDSGGRLTSAAEDELAQLVQQYKFFHWHLEFPEVFRVVDETRRDHNPDTGWQSGFTCVIANPTWDRVKLQEQEFFADRRPDIANAPNAAQRKRKIEALRTGDEVDRELHRQFRAALRQCDVWYRLLRDSGRYPLTGQGDINRYAVYAETGTALIAPVGRSGMFLPTGIATDATTAKFFGTLVRNSRLASFEEFENEAFLLSKDVDHRVRFCLLSACGRGRSVPNAAFAFGVRYIQDLPERRLIMPPSDLLLVNPNTGTTPLFRSRRDADITLGIYRHVSVLWRDEPEENPWGVSFLRMFDMSNDSHLFRPREDLLADDWMPVGNVFVKNGHRMLPLYEAKMIHYFDHRYGTYEGQTEAQARVGTLPRPSPSQKRDPEYVIEPRYWVPEFSPLDEEKSTAQKKVYETGVATRLSGHDWYHDWLIGWRDTGRSTDERTMIISLLPRAGVSNKLPLALTTMNPAPLIANLSSFIFDFVVRQKVAGATMNFFLVKQFPVLSPDAYDRPGPWDPQSTLASWVASRVLELSFTALGLREFARYLGDDGPPFAWDKERRFKMRAELDAAYFHLYSIDRDDVDYIMDSFGAFRRNDPDRFAQTKALILQVYDEMAQAAATGTAYRTLLDPPPGHGPRHQGQRH